MYAKLLFKKILFGVKSIHKNRICHRDLKPQNILLDDNYNPKICDFGLAEETRKKNVGPRGTYEYVSLEVFKFYSDGIKVDIFALGIILYNLVTGVTPFYPCVIDLDEFRYITVNLKKK